MKNEEKSLARRYALQFLYSKGHPFLDGPSHQNLDGEIDEFNKFYSSLNLVGGKNIFVFGKKLILDFIHNHSHIRNKIKYLCFKKNFEKLSRIEKSILMMGGMEILCRENTPNLVAINEYINLSKEFGHEKTSSFVNGVLDGLAKDNSQ